MKKTLFTLIMLISSAIFSTSSAATADSTVGVNKLSDDYMQVSLVTVTSGKQLTNCLGNTALHVKCVAEGEDVCYTFSPVSEGCALISDYILNRVKARYQAVPTAQLVNRYKKEGRGIAERELNFTPQERLALSKRLKALTSKGAEDYIFDLTRTGSSAMMAAVIDSALADESAYISYPALPDMLQGTHSTELPFVLRHSPWYELALQLFMPRSGITESTINSRFAPETMSFALRYAELSSYITVKRPALKGYNSTLQTAAIKVQRPWLTPRIFAIILLVITAIMSFVDMYIGYKWFHWVYDTLLMTIYTLLGLLITTMVVTRFGDAGGFNWFVLVINPLPLLLWLFCRKRLFFRYIYRVYTISLAMFIIFSLWQLPQMSVTMLLFMLSVCIRCIGICRGQTTRRKQLATA